jgi:hypothetical protein
LCGVSHRAVTANSTRGGRERLLDFEVHGYGKAA